MRILLYTGKGGVGKTTIAAGTAALLARRGKRVLIMSADQAHSLGDVFSAPVSGTGQSRDGADGAEGPDAPAGDFLLEGEVKNIAPGLDALELNPGLESRKAWGSMKDYLRQIISDKANGGLAAEEAILFPGLEELFSLLKILEIYDENRYDVLIVDCAPTGETLSLLRYPERLCVLSDSILPSIRSMNRALGGLISRKTTVPKPRDEVFAEFESLVKRLNRLREILTDRRQCSVRIVTTPERIVLEEARRSFAWLQAYDFGVDAVYMNRLLPGAALEGYFGAFGKVQEESLGLMRAAFPGRKQFSLELWSGELRGLPLLTEAAELLYGKEDPAEVWCEAQAFRMEDEAGTRKFILQLPHVREDEIEVRQDGTDLILTVRNEVRMFHLPDRVSRRYVSGWSLDGDELCIRMDYD